MFQILLGNKESYKVQDSDFTFLLNWDLALNGIYCVNFQGTI